MKHEKMIRNQVGETGTEKLSWHGRLISIQPRIRLLRSFDQRSHSYLGYVLRLRGEIDSTEQEYTIGIGKAAQSKHLFRVGDIVSGQSLPVRDERLEPVEYYQTSKLKLVERAGENGHEAPPWHDPPPGLEIYRQRGHRRLAARTYELKCSSCMWSCMMAVEMIIDHWQPWKKRYRQETFCYGPKSCSFHKSGPTRKVPGRKGMSWEEEDWIDEEDTSHRGLDE